MKLSKTSNIEVMQNFTLQNIPTLDICVLAALELFSSTKIPKMRIPYKRPLVVGSGNAIATGRIIFPNGSAIFANEGTYEQIFRKNKDIDGVVLISASGSKHAPIIAKAAKKYKKHVTLITNTANSPAAKYLDRKHTYDEFVFPKNREPYTYNTSTYMGMMLAHTKENPSKILHYITKSTTKLQFPNFKRYKRFFLIVPEEFEGIIRLLNVKFIELFGRRIARDVETHEYMKHAVTVVPGDELFISFGKKDTRWGKNNFHVPLPKNADYVAMMAISYFIIGKIQAAQPAWFSQHINEYTKRISQIFNRKITPIVE